MILTPPRHQDARCVRRFHRRTRYLRYYDPSAFRCLRPRDLRRCSYNGGGIGVLFNEYNGQRLCGATCSKDLLPRWRRACRQTDVVVSIDGDQQPCRGRCLETVTQALKRDQGSTGGHHLEARLFLVGGGHQGRPSSPPRSTVTDANGEKRHHRAHRQRRATSSSSRSRRTPLELVRQGYRRSELRRGRNLVRFGLAR